MFGLCVILFFSATGLTLNHPTWFFHESTRTLTGAMDVSWLNNGAPVPSDWDENDYGYSISKLEVVEALRAKHAIRGQVSSFISFSDECEVGFEGPGYLATAKIDRDDGNYSIDIITTDLVSLLNDLHKGRHTGAAWSLLIDASALIGIASSLTGFGLIFFLRLRRFRGFIFAILGAALLCGFCLWAIQ
jgi:uncharacterized protein